MQTVNLMYFTSDHLAFFDETSAHDHATTLADTTVSVMDEASVAAAVGTLHDWDDTDELEF